VGESGGAIDLDRVLGRNLRNALGAHPGIAGRGAADSAGHLRQ